MWVSRRSSGTCEFDKAVASADTAEVLLAIPELSQPFYSPRRIKPTVSTRFYRPISAVFCVLLTTVFLSGCNNNREEDATVAGSGKGNAAAPNQETEGEKCRNKLAGAIRRVGPEALSVQANPERSINGLNAWIASCAADEMSALEISDATLKMVDSNPRVTAGRFTANDAWYIRDSLLLRDLTSAVWERTDSDDKQAAGKDALRVIRLFQWLVRNVSLLPDGADRVPLGPFDVLLTGRGTPQDRAWIFVEALRQQYIHSAFIVSTEAEPEEDGDLLTTAEWLVVVQLEDGSMLFDPTVGVAVPSGEKLNLKAPAPASVAALAEHPRWKSVSVRLVAQLATFAPRMLVLQNQLEAEDSAVLYEELTGGISDTTPLIDLAVSAGDGLWTAKDVSIWAYPEEQVVAAASLSEGQLLAYTNLLRPFDAPFERAIQSSRNLEDIPAVPRNLSDEERKQMVEERIMKAYEVFSADQSSENMFGTPSRRLLKARISQIMGHTDTSVIQQLQQIRITSMQDSFQIAVPEAVREQVPGMPKIMTIPFPPLVREVNQSSTGDSLYWTAMCQMDRGEVGASITTLANYRRQYPDGKWKYPSMVSHAEALLQQERTEDAIAMLQQANQDDNPEKQRVALMLDALQATYE